MPKDSDVCAAGYAATDPSATNPFCTLSAATILANAAAAAAEASAAAALAAHAAIVASAAIVGHLSAADWAYFDDKVNRSGDTMTGTLTLRTGAALAGTAPTKLPFGILMTVPEASALESSPSGLFFTTLGDRRSLMQSSRPIVASTTVSNTLVETVIYTTALAANELIAGETVFTHIFGYMSTANAAVTLTFRVKVGGVTILTLTTTAGVVVNEPVSIEPIFTVRSVGVGGTVFGYAKSEIANKGKSVASVATVVINTTLISDVTITAQWDQLGAGNSFTVGQGWSDAIW